jgi:nucleoside-diphosphate-sugar epimerase
VHGLDVARAAVHLMTHSPADGACFNVACPDVLTAGQLLATVLRVGGRRLADLDIPYPDSVVRGALPLLSYRLPFDALNRTAGALWQRVVNQTGIEPELAPRVDPEMTAYMAGNMVFDPARLLATGFTFRFPTFEAGWQDTVDWYIEHGWLPEVTARGAAPAASPRAA